MNIPLEMCHSIVWQGCLSDKVSISKLFLNKGPKKGKLKERKMNREVLLGKEASNIYKYIYIYIFIYIFIYL